jgi:hypothetical protein
MGNNLTDLTSEEHGCRNRSCYNCLGKGLDSALLSPQPLHVLNPVLLQKIFILKLTLLL